MTSTADEMTSTSVQGADTEVQPDSAELLIKEARQATRRRRLGWFTFMIVIALATSLFLAATVGTSKPKSHVGSGNKNPNGSALAISTCMASQLRVASDLGGWHANFAASGQFTETITFTNAARIGCEMKGWPQVQAVLNGVAESTSTTRVIQNAPSKLVHLAPHKTASFDIYGGDWNPISNKACPQTTNGLMVSPPGDSNSDFVKVEEPYCGAFYISPVIAGSKDAQSWSFTVR